MMHKKWLVYMSVFTCMGLNSMLVNAKEYLVADPQAYQDIADSLKAGDIVTLADGTWTDFQTAIGNVQTLPSDLLGKKSVGTLAGFAGMAAKLGAVGLTALVPILTADGNYTPAFVIGASLSVIAMAAVWILIPKVEPLKSLK